MADTNDYQQYTRSLDSLSIGTPVFHPATDLTPGSCGYFDNRGRWKKLLDIPSIRPGDSHYTAIEDLGPLTIAPRQNWGPMYGKTVKCCGIDVKADMQMPNAPVSAGVNLNFEKSKDFGAILLVEPVKLASFSYPKIFDTWCRSNGSAIIQSGEYGQDVKKHGLFIITEAYTTHHCSIITWRGSNNKLGIGVNADAFCAGRLTGHGFWSLATNTGAIRDFPRQPDEGEYAVFVGGLEYKFDWLRALVKHEEPLKERKRGPDDEFTPFGACTSGDYYSVKCSRKHLALPTTISQPLEHDVENVNLPFNCRN